LTRNGTWNRVDGPRGSAAGAPIPCCLSLLPFLALLQSVFLAVNSCRPCFLSCGSFCPALSVLSSVLWCLSFLLFCLSFLLSCRMVLLAIVSGHIPLLIFSCPSLLHICAHFFPCCLSMVPFLFSFCLALQPCPCALKTGQICLPSRSPQRFTLPSSLDSKPPLPHPMSGDIFPPSCFSASDHFLPSDW
jgi:hypothetical protein